MNKLLLAAAFVFLSSAAMACPITDVQGSPVAPPSNAHIPVCHKGYELLYDITKKTPVWVAENRTAEDVSGPDHRDGSFKPDPQLPREWSATDDDYKGATYLGSAIARGHMAPSSDFRRDEEQQHESFLFSNAVPQIQKCNNSGVWAQIERMTRDWTVHYGQMYVVTLPIYKESYAHIGNGVAVPQWIAKVIMNPALNKSLAFLVPNEELCKSKPSDFAVTQDKIEEMTGIKFFTKLSGYERTDKIWP